MTEKPAQTRLTQQRKLVLELARTSHGHPTADELYELAREKDPHISRGTVYRNLNYLADSGELRKVTLPEGPDRYDSNVIRHYHFHCRGCGHIFDLPASFYPDMSAAVRRMSAQGFITEDQRYLLLGLCPRCAAEKQADNKFQ